MWISQENENSQRTPSPQPQKKSGTQKTYHRVGLSFPKSIRLLSRRHFKQVLGGGTSYPCSVLLFRHYSGKGPSRLGITVSAKYGKSFKRNYLKRLVREVFRELYTQVPPGLQLHASPKLPYRPLNKEAILLDFQSLLTELSKKS
jgi:ribonuclease P protein component